MTGASTLCELFPCKATTKFHLKIESFKQFYDHFTYSDLQTSNSAFTRRKKNEE